MTILQIWATRLADAVAPDEVDLAPFVAEAFVKGGREREDIYSANTATIGGFSAGDVITIFPATLRAVAFVAPSILAALSSDVVKDLLGAVTSGLTVAELRMKRERLMREMRPAANAPESDEDPSDVVSSPASEQASRMLTRVIDSMTHELSTAGLSRDQCDLIAYRTLKVLLQDPEGSTQFLRALSSGAR